MQSSARVDRHQSQTVTSIDRHQINDVKESPLRQSMADSGGSRIKIEQLPSIDLRSSLEGSHSGRNLVDTRPNNLDTNVLVQTRDNDPIEGVLDLSQKPNSVDSVKTSIIGNRVTTASYLNLSSNTGRFIKQERISPRNSINEGDMHQNCKPIDVGNNRASTFDHSNCFNDIIHDIISDSTLHELTSPNSSFILSSFKVNTPTTSYSRNCIEYDQGFIVGNPSSSSNNRLAGQSFDLRPSEVERTSSPPLNFAEFRHNQGMICPMCRKAFRFEKNLLRHLQKAHATGNGESVLKCKLCHYTTRHYSNMYVHIRTHTGDKPYSCSACGVAFTQGSSLKLHIKSRHHDNTSFFSLTRKPVKNNLTKLWTRVLKKDLPKYNINQFAYPTRHHQSGSRLKFDGSLVARQHHHHYSTQRRDLINHLTLGSGLLDLPNTHSNHWLTPLQSTPSSKSTVHLPFNLTNLLNTTNNSESDPNLSRLEKVDRNCCDQLTNKYTRLGCAGSVSNNGELVSLMDNCWQLTNYRSPASNNTHSILRHMHSIFLTFASGLKA